VAANRAFWDVFNRSRVPMFVLDDDAVYVEVNAAACQVVGLTREDYVGRPLGFGTDPERQAEVARMWSAFMRTGHLVTPYQFTSPDYGAMRINIVCTAHTPEPSRHLSIYWPQPVDGHGLSPREQEVTQLLALGLTGAQIAKRLVLSPETVRTHIRNAMHGVGAHTRAHLVTRALERGLITPDGAD
jgi:PAS domain S-box-containing protein